MKTRFKLTSAEIKDILETPTFDFPKYSTGIMNLANRNAQGTWPRIVGQMSELIQEFSGKTLEEWEKWYLNKHPDAIEKATKKIHEMIQNFREVISIIDEEMIKNWVKDLVIIKTYIGLRFQEAILKKAAIMFNKSYRLATPEEESKGIDGYIDEIPVSIKPITYKLEKHISDNIQVSFIYYEKKDNDVFVDISGIINELG